MLIIENDLNYQNFVVFEYQKIFFRIKNWIHFKQKVQWPPCSWGNNIHQNCFIHVLSNTKHLTNLVEKDFQISPNISIMPLCWFRFSLKIILWLFQYYNSSLHCDPIISPGIKTFLNYTYLRMLPYVSAFLANKMVFKKNIFFKYHHILYESSLSISERGRDLSF